MTTPPQSSTQDSWENSHGKDVNHFHHFEGGICSCLYYW
jgi:hypothetical protein